MGHLLTAVFINVQYHTRRFFLDIYICILLHTTRGAMFFLTIALKKNLNESRGHQGISSSFHKTNKLRRPINHY